MSEKLPRPTTDDREGWKAYWIEQGMPWRIEPEISEERQRYLADRRRVQPDIERSIYPFKGITLDRADVEWLLATHESDGMQGPVVWAEEKQRHRAGLDLRGADLRGAKLAQLPLARLHAGLFDEELTVAGVVTPAQPDLEMPWAFAASGVLHEMAAAQMESVDLREAHLENACLTVVHLDHAVLLGAHLEQATLLFAYLDDAWLNGTHFEGATFGASSLLNVEASGVHFEGANLRYAQLGGNLFGAHFEGALLQGASFSEETRLDGAWLGSEQDGLAHLADVRWRGTNLALVRWVQPTRAVPSNGQERVSVSEEQQKVAHSLRLLECNRALRANRQLATVLRGQGLNDQADRFAYRAQLLQRRVHRLQRQPARFLGSFILDLISGYGYKPLRSFLTYAVVVLGFATAYLALGGLHGQTLTWNEALVVSMTAFHGRGFFATAFQPGDLQAAVAAVEAFIGLLIEIVLIAAFTQRFFAR